MVFGNHCLGSNIHVIINQMLITIGAKVVNMSFYLCHDLLKNNAIFIMVIELSGVQFGLKSYA